MSGSSSSTSSITVASPPSTAEVAAIGLAFMAAASGVITDYNQGSQVRTFFESFGEIAEEQGIIAQALAYQAIIYGAYAAFGITPLGATAATGSVTFTTPSAATADIVINSGTMVQTANGVLYQTIATATIPTGSTSVSVGIIAQVAGSAGNTSIGSVSVITTTQAYYLTVTNPAAITNGSDAETPAQTFARFTATIMALGQASPVSIANACIGVTNGSEIVRYSNVYEPWVTSMATPLPIGYQVYIDNGSGTASSTLIANVLNVLMGSLSAGESGYHAAGIPFTVSAGTPVTASVVVTATLTDATLSTTLGTAISAALTTYFNTLGFGQPAELIQVTAAVANVLSGYVTSLSVSLEDSTSTPQQQITATYAQRVILSNVSANLT